MPKKRNNNCSMSKFVNKFKELEYMTDIPHTISTGNKIIDQAIAKYGAKFANKIIKTPRGKIAVEYSKKAYPYIEKGGANIARARVAYKEVCKKNN